MARTACLPTRWLTPLLLLAAGCLQPSVRLLEQTPTGGVVVMPNNSDCWPTRYRTKAEALMKEQCPTGYLIEHEEKVVLKEAGNGSLQERYEYDGALLKVNQEESEYRITFRCAQPVPPAPPVQVPLPAPALLPGAPVPPVVNPPAPAPGTLPPAPVPVPTPPAGPDATLPPPRPLVPPGS
jgi:hypothetical protein